MTAPVLKVRVFQRAVIKTKVDIRFPAKVEVLSPILLDRTGGIFTFGFDQSALGLDALYQPVDTDLTAIAELSTTSFGRAFLALADAATARSYLDIIPSREVLTTSRTYYVRSDGSNSNDGLANTSGGAFLTIQKAVNVVAALDLNGKVVTIQVGSGTYSAGANVAMPFVGGVPLLQGDTTTPGNVVISVTGNAIHVSNGAELSVGGFKLVTATGGSGLNTSGAGRINVVGKMEFGACATAHMHSSYAGQIAVSADYTISGGALYHWWSETAGGSIAVIGRTVTLTGTPAFTAFANATIVAQIVAVSNTYSGSATGSRYSVTLNGVILSSDATLPGSTAGSVSTGGQYN